MSDPETARRHSKVERPSAGKVSRRRFLKIVGGAGALASGTVAVFPQVAHGQKTKVTITVWDKQRETSVRNVMLEIARDFQRLHPDVEVISETQHSGSRLVQKITAALAVKKPPTVAQLEPYVMATYQAKKIIEPIDDVVTAVGKDRIYPWLLRLMEYGGRSYGITHGWAAQSLAGRGDYAKPAGVDPSSWKTWDDWLRDMPKLNKPPDYYAYDAAPVENDLFDIITVFLGSNGGHVFDRNGNPVLDSPPVIEMLEFWRRLTPNMSPGWSSHSFEETLTSLANGKAAQILAFPHAIGFIERSAPPDKRNPDVFQVWPTTVGPSGKEPLAVMVNEGWCVFTDAPKAEKQAAREFLKFFYNRENYLKYVDSLPAVLLPIFKDYFTDPQYVSNPMRKKWKPWIDAQERWVARGRVNPTFVLDLHDLQIPWLGAVGRATVIPDLFTAVVVKGEDAKAATKEANRRIEQEVIIPFKKTGK